MCVWRGGKRDQKLPDLSGLWPENMTRKKNKAKLRPKTKQSGGKDAILTHYVQKAKEGRPPKFASPEDLWEQAWMYFKICTKARVLPEKAGLCFTLNISRDTYSEYRKKKEFTDTIKRIDQYIESNWVRRLASQAATGAIFYLKNAFRAEFRDRTDMDVTSGGEKITGMVISKEK